MSSYLITGASRGIGVGHPSPPSLIDSFADILQFALLQHLSVDPENTVIGLVRNKADTEAKVTKWDQKNVHVVEGDLSDYKSLKVPITTMSSIRIAY